MTSTTQTKRVTDAQVASTTRVDSLSCCLVGQETFFISLLTSPNISLIFAIITTDGIKVRNHENTKHYLYIFAREEGLEPPAYGFGDRRSAN